MSKINHYRRSDYELLFRKLYYEINKTEYIGSLNYLTDNILLVNINNLLDRLGLVKMDDSELNRLLAI